MQEGSRKAIFAAFSANLGIAIAKFVGFLLTSSAGLLAEAGHSLADTGNQALLLLGSSRAQKRPNAEHPFGYGRERYFWAFVVALVLFSMGGLFALYEGIQKLIHPHEAESLGIAIGILLFAVCLEGYSLRTAVKETRHVKPATMSYWKFIRSAKQPELPVVLLEDVGAMIGLVLALGGVVVAHVTHNPRWDAAGSISIGVLLVVIAAVLAIEMKGLLIGEGASADTERLIRSSLESAPRVTKLIHLRTEHLGPDELLVAAKLEFDRSLTVAGLAEAIDETEAVLRANVPIARLVYIEPDVAHLSRATVAGDPGAVPGVVRNTDAGRRQGLIAVAIAVVCFSVSSSIVKKSGADGVAVAFWRLLFTSVLWNVILAASGRRLTLARLRQLLLPGACFGLNLACFFLAVNHTAIAHAEFIGASSPMLLVPAGALLFHERVDARSLRWAALAVAGMALVLFAGPPKGAARLGGDLLAMCALFLWTGYLLLGKQARTRLDVAEFMAGVTPIATVAIIPLIVVDDADMSMPWGGWAVAAVLTVVTGLGAHGLIVYAQRHVPVGTMSVMQVAQPALAVGWAFLLLDEDILLAQLIGMALVLLGLGLFTWSSQRRVRAAAR